MMYLENYLVDFERKPYNLKMLNIKLPCILVNNVSKIFVCAEATGTILEDVGFFLSRTS